ncbi:hypothetical protein [Roseospira visakhapatnamensis]|uniref:Uncharacterized protein n=1 Tax=Roseospira visakhapatnamensis TaxID=390880 RepID=A0A7W6RFM2_9PROT|nr:hypothetical protein [Roseospira visakhapatnamensis]MBB4267701.1 hypothetical protein [Roseospira visakhapatnamensis]
MSACRSSGAASALPDPAASAPALFALIPGEGVRLTEAGYDAAYDAARRATGCTKAVIDAIVMEICAPDWALNHLIETAPSYWPTFSGHRAALIGAAFNAANEVLGLPRRAHVIVETPPCWWRVEYACPDCGHTWSEVCDDEPDACPCHCPRCDGLGPPLHAEPVDEPPDEAPAPDAVCIPGCTLVPTAEPGAGAPMTSLCRTWDRAVVTSDDALALLGAWQDLGPDHRRQFLELIQTTVRLCQAADPQGEG